MKLVRLPLVFLAFFLLWVPASGQSPYRILVTNDDGVRAPGLDALVQALTSVGEVTVVAPAENQSGKGHSITITDPVYVDEVKLAGGVAALGLTATPATCVKLGVLALMKERPHLVISGINRGVNSGRVAYVSGTVGAAREGAMHGIPSIASSMDIAGGWSDYSAAAKVTAQVAALVKRNGLPAGVFLNVNVPAGTPKGLRVTAQSMETGHETWVEHKNPRGRRYFWNDYREPEEDANRTTDVAAVAEGYVAVTPLRATEYDRSTANRLKALLK
ncbi:MAG: 5'/3'-nucleotidase SurE [Acidobacteria bacterium]|nr:5'/3'-nucleotidase SurE [Acidobacteriota bacterium]